MPIVALVLGIIGLCVPFLIPVAIVLAIISLVRSSDPAYGDRKAFAIIALIVPLLWIPVAGILAAIAIPNFIRFQARSKQSECKFNLKAAYTAARAQQAEGELTADFASIGFAPEPHRYLYTFGEGHFIAPNRPPGDAETLWAAVPADLQEDLGVHEDHFTIGCAGNLDNDAVVDVWSVSDQARVVNGEPVPAGIPAHHVDDVVD